MKEKFSLTCETEIIMLMKRRFPDFVKNRSAFTEGCYIAALKDPKVIWAQKAAYHNEMMLFCHEQIRKFEAIQRQWEANKAKYKGSNAFTEGSL